MNSDSNYSSVRNLGNTVSLTSATKISFYKRQRENGGRGSC